MPQRQNKLVTFLNLLQSIQKGGTTAIHSSTLSRTHKDRLLEFGFLRKVIKGWYRGSSPDAFDFDDSGWLVVYWNFMSEYLEHRFGNSWCLSPEQSILLYAGNNSPPNQLIVRATTASNNITQFPFETSLFEVKARTAIDDEVLVVDNLRLFLPELALTLVREDFLDLRPIDTETTLTSNIDQDLLIDNIQTANRRSLAVRLADAFDKVGSSDLAERIRIAMDIKIVARFGEKPHLPIVPNQHTLLISPHANRIKVLWESMSESISQISLRSNIRPIEFETYINSMEELYVRDAYHSLSIEGYQVTEELIKVVRDGIWPSKKFLQNVTDLNALATIGYRRSFNCVKKTVQDVLKGKNPGQAINDDHQSWFQALFSANVDAGLLEKTSLIGYRNNQVYIRGSRHIPMNASSLQDCIEVFFKLLELETDPFARVVLGHFFFVYIHPYFDGNGRMGRFIMNVMFAAAGIPWMVIEVFQRNRYFKALEKAGARGDILPFAEFLHELIDQISR